MLARCSFELDRIRLNGDKHLLAKLPRTKILTDDKCNCKKKRKKKSYTKRAANLPRKIFAVVLKKSKTWWHADKFSLLCASATNGICNGLEWFLLVHYISNLYAYAFSRGFLSKIYKEPFINMPFYTTSVLAYVRHKWFWWFNENRRNIS